MYEYYKRSIYNEKSNNSQSLLEPNVLYFDDKPPKIVNKKYPTKRKKLLKKKEIEQRKCTPRRKSKEKLQTSQLKHIMKQKNEGKNVDEQIENTESNDPLFTPQTEVKIEIHDEKLECRTETDDSEADWEKYNLAEEEFLDENIKKSKRKTLLYSHGESEHEEDFELNNDEEQAEQDEDDEPLILLKEISGNKKSKKNKEKMPRLRNCLETCKHKCTIKFLKAQRIDIFDYYWHLNKENKVNFIRQHIRKRVLTRIRNKKRGNNCCYFLKCYKIGAASLVTPISSDLTKVCRKFFEGTLGIANRDIKDALEGYELQHEKIIRPLRDIIKEEQSKLIETYPEKPARPQQFLDPETGNLTDTKPKKKHKRRKPGEPEPERFPRAVNCAIRCIFKCHLNFSEEDRKQICDIFWSLDFKRRKDFILARIETKDVETPTTPEFRKTDRPTRAYQTRFYLRSGINSENKRVCKHFMMNTLCINRKFIENAIKYADKTTGNYTGVDGRGKHLVHKITPERKQAILDHINSYPIWMPSKKSKLRCLHHSLSIKRMYKEYRDKCLAASAKPVSAFYYYKIFHDEFRLLFLSNKAIKKGRGFLNINPNISHYTGDEPGGSWLDFKGNLLDVNALNPAKSLKFSHLHPMPTISCSSKDSTKSHELNQTQTSLAGISGLHLNQPLNFTSSATAQHLANFVDASTSAAASTSSPRTIFQTTVQTLYDNSHLPHTSVIEPDNNVEQPMGDSSKIPTEEEINNSGELRKQAAEAYNKLKFQEAIDLYTQAIEINPGNALFHAKRGEAFLKINKPNACICDCNKALEINCDSAAAYKFRGRANRLLGNWEDAAKDLRQASKLDYDDQTDAWLREVTPNARKLEQHRLKHQRKNAEKERKAEEFKRQNRQQQTKPQKASTSGFAGGFPGFQTDDSNGGMNMGDLLSGMNDPEVMAALQEIAKNPANIDKYKSNPKISKLIDVVKSNFPGGGSMFPGAFFGAAAANGGGATPPPTAGADNEPKEAPKKPDFADDGLD